MKKKGLIVLASCLALSAIALTGCGHEHSKQSTWTVGDDTHWHACSGCSDKFDETAHAYDQEVATSDYLKAEATASTKAQYWKSCECGKASTTEHFEVNKTVATLANIQNLSKTYDGEAVANPTYDTNSNGAVTIEWYKGATQLTTAPADAGTYKVKVIVAESTTHTAISEEKEFTIAKKVLSNLTANLPYAGTDSFEVTLGTEHGIVASDVADGIKVCITFANKNAGAQVTGAGLDAVDGDSYLNYELDLNTCVANIVPKVLNGVTYNFTYSNNDYYQVVLTSADHSGIIGEEEVTLEVCFEDTIVGSAVDTSSPEMAPTLGDDNYTLGTYTFAIVPKVLNVPTLTKDYNGNNTVNYAFTATDGLVSGDSCALTFNVEATNIGYYENAAMTNIALTNANYEIEVSTCNLHILDANDLVMLVTNKQNVEGDFILVVDIMQGTVRVGDSIVLPGTTDKVYEVSVIEKFSKQYEFATVGEEVGLYVSGMTDLTEVPGSSFLYELNNVPEMATEFLADIHMLTKEEGGRQTAVFDVNAYKPNLNGLGASQEISITLIDIYESDDTILNPGGRAFVKITLANQLPACLLETATFKLFEGTKYVGDVENIDLVAYDSFTTALVLDCDTAYSETMDIRAGQKVYVKINGADGTLNDFYFKATTGSAATFTYEQYNVTDTTTPYHSVTTATNTYYMDVNGTDDLYLVVTCVTAGEISISVA